MTLAQLIDHGAEDFAAAGLWFGHGTDNAWDEAAWLAAHVMQLRLPLAPAKLKVRPDPTQQQKIEALFQQRIDTRQPAAYLLNEAWFCGLKFYVDQRVLVPRSPLAELIHAQFAPWKDADSIKTILDIGTGSGCIAIACAKQLPHVQIVATDISQDALTVAAINVEQYGVGDRVRLVQSGLFDALPVGKMFDIIISNPPYVSDSRCEELPAEYQHEPRLGLASGAAGLDHAIPLLENAHRHLNDEGILILEVGESQQALERYYPQVAFNWLQFAHGGEGVCLLDKQQLLALAPS